MKLILASKSPRRAEILRNIGLDFEIRVSDAEEYVPDSITEPCKIVEHLASLKAHYLKYTLEKNEILIAADTLVFDGNSRLGKPADSSDAFRMLRELSGKKHTVITGIAIMSRDNFVCDSVATDVYFKELSDKEIESYILTKEPLDKAGAYGIQGLGGKFVKRIDGDYFSGVGLPVCRLCEILSNDFKFDL